jgi:flagellar hook protein FlgE
MADLFNIAVTGMQAQQNNMAVIGNNISNSGTAGYKASSLSFAELFSSNLGQYSNGILTQYGNGVTTTGVTTDWSSGSVVSTGTDSNLAISGEGFLPVSYQGEIYYTRAGDFTLTETTVGGATVYVFMRPDGSILLGAATQDTTNGVTGAITATSYVYFDSAPTSYEISASGEVSATGANVVNAYIGVQRFNNPDSLEKIEGGLFKPTSLTSYNTGSSGSETPAIPGENGSGTLLQGNLEESNTDLVTEFTKLIKSQRAFQGCSKVITTADEVLQTVLNLK